MSIEVVRNAPVAILIASFVMGSPVLRSLLAAPYTIRQQSILSQIISLYIFMSVS